MTQLDLRTELADILAFLFERVRSFNPESNHGPGEGKKVRRVDVGYQCDQAGWVALVFDTRPDAEPDGQWNSYIEGNTLDRPRWFEAMEANEEQPVRVIMPDGSERELPPESSDEITTILGDLLKGALLMARQDGVFSELPRDPECEMGVEEHDGGYGWPAYEDRAQARLS